MQKMTIAELGSAEAGQEPVQSLIDETTSLVDEKAFSHHEGLHNIELKSEHQAMGTLPAEVESSSEGERKLERFKYFSSEESVRGLSEKLDKPELSRRLEELGFDDYYFNVYTREGVKFEEKVESSRVYVLLHGWTATHEIFSEVEKENQLTIIEEILARDPSAIIVAPDGNGFGKTNFKSDLSANELNKKCTAESYADQIDFLLSDVLDIPDDERDRINIYGHSMGGVCAAYLTAKHGYKNSTAIAPALFPKRSNIAEAAKMFKDHDERDMLLKAVLQFYRNTDFVYHALSKSIQIGEMVSSIHEPFVDETVGAVVDFIGEYLMGAEITGDSELDKKMSSQLKNDIHRDQFLGPKRRIAAAALAQLKNDRMDFSKFNLEQLERLQNLMVFYGNSDTLVTTEDIRKLIVVVDAFTVMRSIQHIRETHEIPENVIRDISKTSEDYDKLVSQAVIRTPIEGGHYAPLFSKKAIKALVDNAKATHRDKTLV